MMKPHFEPKLNPKYHVFFPGDYTLDINPVDLEDDARFQCQIGAADGIAPIRSRYATLTVKVPPEPPKLLPSGDELKTVEGRQVELRCESRGGKPASEVSLSKNTYSTIGLQRPILCKSFLHEENIMAL